MKAHIVLTNQHLLDNYLQQVGAMLPAKEFCNVVSDYYHEVESRYYDQVHQEIFEDETTTAWRIALKAVEASLPKRLRVLDIGCGTGFAAETVLKTLRSEKVEHLTCIDPSSHMLAICEKKLACYPCDKTFEAMDISHLRSQNKVFDLVVTNSVVHHVFDLGAFFRNLNEILAPGGIYICGHEPSALHYTIEDVRHWNQKFRCYMRLKRALKPKRTIKRLLATLGLIPTAKGMAQIVNERLLAAGHIRSPLAGNAIQKMVDIHVPQSTGEFLWGQPGFSPQAITGEFLSDYKVVFSATYHHIKAPSRLLGRYWRRANNRLKERYPNAGADIIMAFRKPAC